MCQIAYGKLSTKLGAMAVVVRQTNVVWVLFVACSGVIDITLAHQRDGAKVDLKASNKGATLSTLNSSVNVSSILRKRKPKGNAEANKHSSYWTNTSSTSRTAGAKEAHSVSPHFAQIMYFSLISALFAASLNFTIGHALDLFQSFRKNRLHGFFLGFLALIACLLSVRFFSIGHPYLLADNRHYTFYLRRKIIKFHWSMKYLLVPILCLFMVLNLPFIGQSAEGIWVLVYFLATSACLVPAPLIEFRYHTIPFYIQSLMSLQ